MDHHSIGVHRTGRSVSMSRYQVDKLLRDLRRDESVAARFRSDIELVLDGYQLDTAERDLLKRWDVRSLYERGANPLLLMLANGAAGKTMRDYARMMNPRPRDGGK
jgi:aromatic-ring opening dioxygenase LigAB LigA subunit